jgi:hypothetical protein
MNTPGFNAAASLYKTSGHYLSSRNMINLSTQMAGAIHPAEVIEVEGCRPGFIQIGEGDNMVCIDPNNPWAGRGGGSSGFGTGSGGGGGRGGGGGGGSRGTKTPGHFCKPGELGGFASWEEAILDCGVMNAGTPATYLWCVPNRGPMCCARKRGRTTCVDLPKYQRPPV